MPRLEELEPRRLPPWGWLKWLKRPCRGDGRPEAYLRQAPGNRLHVIVLIPIALLVLARAAFLGDGAGSAGPPARRSGWRTPHCIEPGQDASSAKMTAVQEPPRDHCCEPGNWRAGNPSPSRRTRLRLTQTGANAGRFTEGDHQGSGADLVHRKVAGPGGLAGGELALCWLMDYAGVTSRLMRGHWACRKSGSRISSRLVWVHRARDMPGGPG
jgi:hypothetical protein